MKLSTVVIVVAGAGAAYFLWKRYRSAGTAPSPLAGTPIAGGILDPTAWGA